MHLTSESHHTFAPILPFISTNGKGYVARTKHAWINTFPHTSNHFLPLFIPSDITYTYLPSRFIWNQINRCISMEALSSPGGSCQSPRDIPPSLTLQESPSTILSTVSFCSFLCASLNVHKGLQVSSHSIWQQERKEAPEGAGHSTWVSKWEHLPLHFGPCL